MVQTYPTCIVPAGTLLQSHTFHSLVYSQTHLDLAYSEGQTHAFTKFQVSSFKFLQIKFFVFDFQIDKMYILKLCKGMRLAFAIRKVKVSLAVN